MKVQWQVIATKSFEPAWGMNFGDSQWTANLTSANVSFEHRLFRQATFALNQMGLIGAARTLALAWPSI